MAISVRITQQKEKRLKMVRKEKDERLNYRVKLRVGQRVKLPKLSGDLMVNRPGKVVAEYPTYYVVKTDAGYKETVHRYGSCEVIA